MNRIAILYPLALLCISFALAQQNREILSRIKGAIVIDPVKKKNSHTFEREEVVLYKTVDAKGSLYHNVRDGSGIISPKFRILPYRTAVTEEAISIRYSRLIITLIPDGESSFALYRKLFPDENFTHHYSVTGTFDKVEEFDKMSLKFLENDLGGEWLFTALKGDTPRLIFPVCLVVVDPTFDESADKKIIANLNANRGVPLTIELDDPTQFDEFFKMINQVWICRRQF